MTCDSLRLRRTWTLLGFGWILLSLASQTEAKNLFGIKTVFLIVMENLDWADIRGNTNAPFINQALLPMAAEAERYFNPTNIHPSKPNYLWLEAGTNFGIRDDLPLPWGLQTTTNHLVSQLQAAGVTWRSYQEGISGTNCPTADAWPYVARHQPFVFFTDVVGNPDYCIQHIRPYSELASDLSYNAVARYNFITPDLCHDMHEACVPGHDPIRDGDEWLATEIPQIMASRAYQDDGAIFLVWDEGTALISDGPIGLLVISPRAKGNGYSNNLHYTHSSLVRTLQEIFEVGPWLGDAAYAADLRDLFQFAPRISGAHLVHGRPQLEIAELRPGATYIVEVSSDLTSWTPISTNTNPGVTLIFQHQETKDFKQRFYRVWVGFQR